METLKSGFLNSLLVLVLFTGSSFTPNDGTLQYYKGTINGTLVQMSLELEGTKMSGSFIYEESGEVFVLIGEIGKSSQSVILDVINDKDVHVAQIQAHYYTNDLEEIMAIKGGFIDLKTNKRRYLDLEKVAEFISKNDEKTQGLF